MAFASSVARATALFECSVSSTAQSTFFVISFLLVASPAPACRFEHVGANPRYNLEQTTRLALTHVNEIVPTLMSAKRTVS